MTLEYKGIHINYLDEGQGKPIVLLHGFLENSTMWKNLTPHLLKNNRVISIDLLGHGKTHCLGYVHTMEDMADAVNAVLIKLNINECTLIGHSMGGYVALAYAEVNSEKINGLCLMNSTAQEDSEERKLNRDRAIKAVKHNHKVFVSMAVTNLFAIDNRTRLSKEIEDAKTEALKTPLQGIIAALEGMKIRKDRTHILKESGFKKMLIVGKKDHILNTKTLKVQTENTDVQIVEFSDGHMSHIENKEELSYNIIHFV